MAHPPGPEPSETILTIKVTPRSSKNEVTGMEGSCYKIKLTSPPVEGKANQALREFLSRKLRVPKGSIEIISGEHGRIKRVSIQGLGSQTVSDLLKNG